MIPGPKLKKKSSEVLINVHFNNRNIKSAKGRIPSIRLGSFYSTNSLSKCLFWPMYLSLINPVWTKLIHLGSGDSILL